MNLLNYFEFVIESADSFRLYYSKSFKDILYRIRYNFEYGGDEHSIAIFLINVENSNQIIDKFTLIDATEKNDTISLIQGNRILRKFPHLTDDILTSDIVFDEKHEFWKSTSRTQIGIGRWSRRIIKDVYKTTKYNDVALEKFVNAYKFTFDSIDETHNRFEIVSGDDIKKWYLKDNYKIIRGQLGNSCMRHRSNQSFFEIYTKNPKVCKLLILKDKEDSSKIVGRSLLWSLTNGKKYQDRIYVINDSDKLFFENWADSNNYLKYNDSSSLDYLEVQLSDNKYEKYPYMDTFIVYNKNTKILRANKDLWPNKGYIKIQNLNGSYTSDNVVYSEYHGDYIERENAVWCFTENSGMEWIHEDYAIYLDYRDEWWVLENNIVLSNYHDAYFLIDDVERSIEINDYLWIESNDVIKIETGSNEVDYIPKKRIDLYIEVDSRFFSRSNVIKDPYTNKYEFKDKWLGDKTYHKFLKEKLEKELGSNKDLLVDTIIKEFKENDYTDIENLLKQSPLYNDIWGVYWGLSKEMMPTEKDMICLLFTAIVINTGTHFPNYINKFDEEVYKKYNVWKGTDRRLITKINRFIESFDYTNFGTDIYKVWLWFSL